MATRTALYDYDASNPNELSYVVYVLWDMSNSCLFRFKEHDVMTLIEDEGDWLQAKKNATGEQGLVPHNYVERSGAAAAPAAAFSAPAAKKADNAGLLAGQSNSSGGQGPVKAAAGGNLIDSFKKIDPTEIKQFWGQTLLR